MYNHKYNVLNATLNKTFSFLQYKIVMEMILFGYLITQQQTKTFYAEGHVNNSNHVTWFIMTLYYCIKYATYYVILWFNLHQHTHTNTKKTKQKKPIPIKTPNKNQYKLWYYIIDCYR